MMLVLDKKLAALMAATVIGWAVLDMPWRIAAGFLLVVVVAGETIARVRRRWSRED